MIVLVLNRSKKGGVVSNKKTAFYLPENCPACAASFVGKPIPKALQWDGGGTHYSRVIGMDGGYAQIYDGVVAYKCPDCGHYFATGDASWHIDVFEKFIAHIQVGNIKNEP